MWHNLPFSKRNKATERAARVEVEGDRKEWGGGGMEGWTKFEKWGKGRQYNGGLHKIGGFDPSTNYAILVLFSRRIIYKEIIFETANIQLHKFKFKEGPKLF